MRDTFMRGAGSKYRQRAAIALVAGRAWRRAEIAIQVSEGHFFLVPFAVWMA